MLHSGLKWSKIGVNLNANQICHFKFKFFKIGWFKMLMNCRILNLNAIQLSLIQMLIKCFIMNLSVLKLT